MRRYIRYDIRTGVKKIKTKKFISGIMGLALTAAFAAVLSVGGGAAQAAGPVCTVPGDYATIQSAVNDLGCNTINVAAGTYAESVSINHALTLNGPNVGKTGSDVTRVAEAIVNQVNITASDVIVDGFSFDNPGIQMNINGATTLSGVIVQNNIFSGYDTVGFPTFNAGNLLVTRNLFHNPLRTTEAMQIKAGPTTLGGCDGTVVSDNVFTAATTNGSADINFSCTGSDSTNVTVSGNTDTGLTADTSFTAFSGVVSDIVVTNNTVTGTATSGSAIFFFGGVTGRVDINNNSITGGGGSAIAVRNLLEGNNTGAFTITNNDLSLNNQAVSLGNAFDSGASVTATRNNLSGDTTAGIANASATLVADGTCNWWGSASGPGPVGPGTGSNVTTGVTFAPWLVTSDLNGPCSGSQVATNKDQCKKGGWMTLTDQNDDSFRNQGQCVSWTNGRGQ